MGLLENSALRSLPYTVFAIGWNTFYGAILFRYDVSYKSHLSLLMMGYLYIFYKPQVNIVFQNSFQVALDKIV